MSRIIYTSDTAQALRATIDGMEADRTFVLCDRNTAPLCPLPIQPIIIAPSDAAKTLETLAQVWQALQEGGATRHSILLNVGGGMVTDLGGFAAATFKRGIRFVNVPTTLLAMVDAAVGGKTGINFGGLKNEVGAFREAEAVVIDTHFLSTLDQDNLRSGYAEMLKHALLHDAEMWAAHINFELAEPNLHALQDMVRQSIEVKQNIVAADPHEHGIRKALNLGHTVGHAIESFYLASKPGCTLLHGYAVAWGLVAELYMAAAQCEFPSDLLRQTARFIFDYYGHPAIGCNDYDTLYNFMRHDKKNCGDHVNFTLLSHLGHVELHQRVERTLVDEALDFLRDA